MKLPIQERESTGRELTRSLEYRYRKHLIVLGLPWPGVPGFPPVSDGEVRRLLDHFWKA